MSETVGILFGLVLLGVSDVIARLLLWNAERRAARMDHFSGPCGRWTESPVSVPNRR